MQAIMWLIPVLAYVAHYASAFAYRRLCTWTTIGSPMCTFFLTVMFNSNAHIAEVWFFVTTFVLGFIATALGPCRRYGSSHHATPQAYTVDFPRSKGTYATHDDSDSFQNES